MEQVKVKMETRWFIECPNGCCEVDVDSYEISEFECPECGGKWQYNSEPQNCEAV